MASPAALNALLDKTSDWDKDERYMATNDLIQELQKDAQLDAAMERRVCAAVLRQQRVARLQRLRRGARGQCAFLLYLDAMTWEGRTGAQLAEEVGEVLQAGFPLLMLHECDPQRSSCEFERFFQVAAGDA